MEYLFMEYLFSTGQSSFVIFLTMLIKESGWWFPFVNFWLLIFKNQIWITPGSKRPILLDLDSLLGEKCLLKNKPRMMANNLLHENPPPDINVFNKIQLKCSTILRSLCPQNNLPWEGKLKFKIWYFFD